MALEHVLVARKRDSLPRHGAGQTDVGTSQEGTTGQVSRHESPKENVCGEQTHAEPVKSRGLITILKEETYTGWTPRSFAAMSQWWCT